MTSQAPPRDRAAAPQTSGSAAAAEEFRCEVCERTFQHRIALYNHRKSHDLKPGEQPGVEPDIKVRRAPKVSQKELAELQSELAENIHAVGGMMHGVLTGLKAWRLQHPDARLRIPRTSIDLPVPALETHLPYTIMSCSEITARVVAEHAAQNEMLLRWVIRFNGWFKGGEVGQLVGAHVVAGAMTAGVRNPLMETAGRMVGLAEVMSQVDQENAELRHQVAQLQARLQQEAGAWRPPQDERGAGS